jgi:myosin heavy subunit
MITSFFEKVKKQYFPTLVKHGNYFTMISNNKRQKQTCQPTFQTSCSQEKGGIIMEGIVILLLLAGLGFLWFRAKSMSQRKKIICSVSAIIAAGVMLAAAGDGDRALSLEAELEKNEELTEENEELMASNTELIASNTTLEEKLNELETKLKALTEELDEVKEENTSLQRDYDEMSADMEAYTEEISALEAENEALQEQLKEKEKAISSSTASSESGDEGKDQDNTETAASSEQEVASESVANDASSSSSGDCDIKGSQNGIYHIPGSTYYDRTTNVVQWFCSVEEAENAGYRAPKR